eukprot:TRINITY_DN3468_c0_g1_i2.p1 TRINITY_DN3468_c0_g1~~TRINITY_DN3468_c0_g1_i2.p1  ORF type:complete len:327 (-),score=62.14 TRINITY_DN3468_c0_g1_i2:11-991(-)
MVGRSHFVFLFVVLCFSWTNMPPETRPFEFDRVREWGIAGSFLNFNTFSIWYRDTAQVDKPAMLFVHGFPTSSFDFVDIWDDLCKDYRCIAVDSLGFGFSSKPDRYNYTITEQADIHEAVVLSLPQTSAPIDLVCHDYGVSICQELLARYEELKSSAKIQIRSVAFLNGGLIPDAHHPLMIQRVLTVPILGPLLSRLSTQYFFDSSMRKVFGVNTRPSRKFLDQSWSLICHNGGWGIPHELLGYIAERRLHADRWVGVLKSTSVPVRLINGPADPVSGKHLVDAYKQLVPHGDVALLPADIGHYPQVEAPLTVIHTIRSFHRKLNE